MIKVYKIVHGYYDSECVPYLQPSLYHYTRSHNRKLFKLNSHLELRRHCLTICVVSNWNLLPSDVVNTSSINAFKSRLDQILVLCRVSLRLWKLTPSSVGNYMIWIHGLTWSSSSTCLCVCMSKPIILWLKTSCFLRIKFDDKVKNKTFKILHLTYQTVRTSES